MIGFSELCALGAGMLISSAVWLQMVWKEKDFAQRSEKELMADKDVLLGEIAEYAMERERFIEAYNSYLYNTAQVREKLVEAERREQEIADLEEGLREREKAYLARISELEGLLKGAREKARRKTRLKRNSTPPSV